MTREDIIRMAGEAGFFIQQNEIYSMSTQSDQELTEWIERFAALVASAERQKCIDLVMGLHQAQMGNHNYYHYAANALMTLRGEK